MNITMQHLTQATACFPLVFCFLFHGKYTSHGASLLYHMTFEEVYTRRRKEVESKHHGAVKELTSEHQRFDRTEILFYLRKNGGYIHNSLGGRSVLVVRQAGRSADKNLIYGIFKIL